MSRCSDGSPRRRSAKSAHRMSPEHLQRYVDGFAYRHDIRDFGTIDQTSLVARSMPWKRFTYRDLIAETGQSSPAT